MIVWRRDAPRALVTSGAAAVVAGAAAPWVASGTVRRSSFEMAGLVDRLGFAPSGPVGIAVRMWALVPVCVIGAVVCVWWRRPLVATLLATAGGTFASAVSLAVWRAPDAGLVRVLGGPGVTFVGGVALVAGGAVTALAARTTHRAVPAPASASPAGRS